MSRQFVRLFQPAIIGADGLIAVDEAKVAAREEAIVRQINEGEGDLRVLLLGARHDLRNALWWLRPANVRYGRVTMKPYRVNDGSP